MKKFFISALIALSAMSANASNGVFRIVNKSVEPIVRVYVSPPNRTSYGTTDLLGANVIFPGEYGIVDPGRVWDSENRCVLDVLALGDNGPGNHNEESSYPAIENVLEHNRVEFGQFFVYPEMDPYAESHMVPSPPIGLNRTAMIQYLIDNGQTVLTVEIKKCY